MRLITLKSACEELYASFSSLGVSKQRSIEQFQKSFNEYYPLVEIDSSMFNITITRSYDEYKLTPTRHCHIRIKKRLLKNIETSYPEALV